MTLLMLSFLLTFLTIYSIFLNINWYFSLPLFPSSSNDLNLSFSIDWMSLMFSSSVTLITSAIFIFSFSYISKKDHNRFSLTTILFVISMLLLIFSNNIFFLMLGWDGLGLSSYILVIFYLNHKSKESGALTILSNRMGDIAIIFSIGIHFMNGSWSFILNEEFSKISLLLLFLAAATKSAQFPFSAWLPAAMAAPTPISALVHSSTLVTAGAFIMIRLSLFFHPYLLFLILVSSSITLFFSSLSANWEYDLKKIIALSTLSQIAIIMFSISIKAWNTAFFHLITHAMFKSTLFLCAGFLIHMSTYQDLRTQGMNSNTYLSISSSMNLCNMALMGLPFLSGFYSKDAIIENFLFYSLNLPFIIIMFLSLGLTSSYSMRLFNLSFTPKFLSSPETMLYFSKFLTLPIIFMTPISIFLGAALSWMIIPHQILIIPLILKMLIPLLIFLGFILGSLIKSSSKMFLKLGESSISLWFLHFISCNVPLNISHSGNLSSKVDSMWLEEISAKGSSKYLSIMSKLQETCLFIYLFPLILSISLPFLP